MNERRWVTRKGEHTLTDICDITPTIIYNCVLFSVSFDGRNTFGLNYHNTAARPEQLFS